MKEIRARAPLRLGLAGGGTDVSPYCDIHGGAVLNATIDRYAYATVIPNDSGFVRIIASDLNIEVHQEKSFPLPVTGVLDLHVSVYNYFVREYFAGEPISLDLVTFCDAPAGSGLGSSSTLVVSMVRAFVEFLNLGLDDYRVAWLAYRIERVDCNLQGGRQDQYAATFGGFNFMEFNSSDHVVVNPLRVKNWIICELEASLILYFTGVSRESAKIIADQSSNVESGSVVTIDAMHGLKREAYSMKECLLRGDMDGMVDTMRQGWLSKKLSASSVTNKKIDHIFDAAISAGALAGKVSGAGGGGFILLMVPPSKRMSVGRKLLDFGGQVSNCHFTNHGSQAWTV